MFTNFLFFAQQSLSQRMSQRSGFKPIEQEPSGGPDEYVYIYAGLGIILLLLSLYDFSRGKAMTKFGDDIKGTQATVVSLIRLVTGIGLILAAGYSALS